MDYSVIDRYIDRLIDETTPDAPIWNIEKQTYRQGEGDARHDIRKIIADGFVKTSCHVT